MDKDDSEAGGFVRGTDSPGRPGATLLSISGLSATCNNGRESVKEMVDVVSDYSNDQDGVSNILEKIFFEK